MFDDKSRAAVTRTRVLLALSLGLFGCANTPRYLVNVPLSEASDRATQTDLSARQIRASSSYSFPAGSTSIRAQGVFSSSWGSPYNPDSQRLMIGHHQVLNVGVNDYNLLGGYHVSYSARSADVQYRITGFYTDAEFQVGSTSGLLNPSLWGLSFDVERLYPVNEIAFSAGVRFATQSLVFSYQNPIYINYEPIESDAISTFGLGLPIGMQLASGSLAVELLVTPTLNFHDPLTRIGFQNDLVGLNVNVPVSFSVGFVF